MTLENSDVSPAIIAENVAFQAGNITFLVSEGRRRRDRQPGQQQQQQRTAVLPASGWTATEVEASLQNAQNAAARSLGTEGQSAGARHRRQEEECTELIDGDANCDCRYTPGDSLYIHYYLAAARQNFAVDGGDTIAANLERCSHTAGEFYLDSDGSGAISAVDAKFLLQVLAGRSFFVRVDVTAASNGTECAAAINASVSGPRDVSDAVAIYFVLDHETSAVVRAIGGSEATLGSTLQTNVFAAARTSDDSVASGAAFGLELLTTVPLSSVGVSAVSVVTSGAEVYSYLYDGRSANATRAGALDQLNVSVPTGDSTATAIVSIGSQGYNAKAVYGESPSTLDCKLANGDGDKLPCSGTDIFLDGTCSLTTDSTCTSRTECADDQVAFNSPNATTDRVCVAGPTASPTEQPTANPTANPTMNPTLHPTASPTKNPTANSTKVPTRNPTANPTVNPTANPTANPKHEPHRLPHRQPHRQLYYEPHRQHKRESHGHTDSKPNSQSEHRADG